MLGGMEAELIKYAIVTKLWIGPIVHANHGNNNNSVEASAVMSDFGTECTRSIILVVSACYVRVTMCVWLVNSLHFCVINSFDAIAHTLPFFVRVSSYFFVSNVIWYNRKYIAFFYYVQRNHNAK